MTAYGLFAHGTYHCSCETADSKPRERAYFSYLLVLHDNEAKTCSYYYQTCPRQCCGERGCTFGESVPPSYERRDLEVGIYSWAGARLTCTFDSPTKKTIEDTTVAPKTATIGPKCTPSVIVFELDSESTMLIGKQGTENNFVLLDQTDANLALLTQFNEEFAEMLPRCGAAGTKPVSASSGQEKTEIVYEHITPSKYYCYDAEKEIPFTKGIVQVVLLPNDLVTYSTESFDWQCSYYAGCPQVPNDHKKTTFFGTYKKKALEGRFTLELDLTSSEHLSQPLGYRSETTRETNLHNKIVFDIEEEKLIDQSSELELKLKVVE